MEVLIKSYDTNKGKNTLFSTIMIIDFYDSPTEALCEVGGGNQWCITSLVYFDPYRNIRVFTLINIENESLSDLKALVESYQLNGIDHFDAMKDCVATYYNNYTGRVFLFMTDWLSSNNYQMTEIPKTSLSYFADIEDVLEQSTHEKERWTDWFRRLGNDTEV